MGGASRNSNRVLKTGAWTNETLTSAWTNGTLASAMNVITDKAWDLERHPRFLEFLPPPLETTCMGEPQVDREASDQR